MADTMQFDLVSPERRLASIEAREVQIPGMDGDMTAMPDHSPLITTLRPGILTVVSAEGETRYAVTGGFAEVTAEGTSVLAEQAIPVADLTSEVVNAMVDEAKEALKTAQPEQVDALNKLVADLGALASQAGLSL
jgi:F-type H+-transporting ATPase subunit epsilon